MGHNEYIDESLRSFLLKLGGRTPEPAGGAALALAGASAAALLSLACHSGARSRAGTPAEDRFAACQREAERLSHHIQGLIEADVEAYRQVTHSLRLPRDTTEQRRAREQSLDAALRTATEVPLRLAEAGLEILTAAASICDDLEGTVLGDLGAAVHLAEATVRGSLRNAHINLAAMSEHDSALAADEQIADMRRRLDLSTHSLSSALTEHGLPG